MKYRKIYEAYHGPIPKDEFGRTYDIHHLDKDRTNNSPENLKALSIQEHYDTHFAQGDWGACARMGPRMKLPHEEISRLAALAQHKLVAENKHHLQKRPDGTSVSSDRVKAGKHHLQKRPDGTSVSSDRVKQPDYNNPFQKRADGTSVSSDRVKRGLLSIWTNESTRKMRETRIQRHGTLNMNTEESVAKAMGTRTKNGTLLDSKEMKAKIRETKIKNNSFNPNNEKSIALGKETKHKTFIKRHNAIIPIVLNMWESGINKNKIAKQVGAAYDVISTIVRKNNEGLI